MNIETSKSALGDALKFLKPAVGNHESQIGVKIEAKTPSGEVRLFTADGTQARVVDLDDTTVFTEGIAVVPFALLNKVVAKAKKDIHLRVVDSRLILETGGVKYEIPLLDAATFPTVAIPEEFPVTVDAETWAAVKAKVLPFASADLMRPVLTQVVFGDGGVAATDSYRLSVLPTSIDDLRLPREIVIGDAPQIHDGTNMVWIREGNRLAGHVRIEGQYPNWKQLIPPEWEYSVQVDGPAFREAVEMVSPVSGNNLPIKLVFDGATLGLEMSSSEGSASTEVETGGLEGDAVTIGLNPAFLAGALKCFTGSARIDFISPLRPIMLSAGDLQHMLMPIRLNS